MKQPIVITEAEMTAIGQRARSTMQIQAHRAMTALSREIKYQPK